MKITQILIFALLIVGGIFAQEEKTPTQTETNATVVEVPLGPSPDALLTHVFPESADRQFYIGKWAPVVLGFTNNGATIFNVTRIQASLVHPFDSKFFLQNFTKQSYFETVAPGEQRSFLYHFMPDPMFEPREFGLVVSIFYSDAEGANFTNVVYNGTTALIEDVQSLDAATLFTYVGIVGVAGLLGFVVYNFSRNLSGKKKGRRVETGTQQDVIDNEWLEGTAAARATGSRSPKSPRAKPKQS